MLRRYRSPMAPEKTPDTRLAIERLYWTHDFYLRDGLPTYAYLGDVCIAYLADCPIGWALRFNCIPFGRPSWNEIYDTHEAAMNAVSEWVRGLDIDPGPDVTNQKCN